MLRESSGYTCRFYEAQANRLIELSGISALPQDWVAEVQTHDPAHIRNAFPIRILIIDTRRCDSLHGTRDKSRPAR
jgi:hypothetical protein